MHPLAPGLRLKGLPPLYLARLPLVLPGCTGLTRWMKGIYFRRRGWQQKAAEAPPVRGCRWPRGSDSSTSRPVFSRGISPPRRLQAARIRQA
ncbi:hypothetical protein ACTPOE_15190 [Castellaniella sp. WN]